MPNLNQINMQNLSNVAGFSAVVLFGSAVAVPGLSVLFALCGVVAGAVWVLDLKVMPNINLQFTFIPMTHFMSICSFLRK